MKKTCSWMDTIAGRAARPLLVAGVLVACWASVAAAGNPLGASADNPLAPAAAKPDPWAGEYTGETLSVTLETVDKDGNYEGKILMGKQSFPATATATAGKVEGQFTYSGQKFGFVLKQTGEDKYVLTSGGKDYALARKAPPAPPAPASPYEGSYQAKNPLAGDVSAKFGKKHQSLVGTFVDPKKVKWELSGMAKGDEAHGWAIHGKTKQTFEAKVENGVMTFEIYARNPLTGKKDPKTSRTYLLVRTGDTPGPGPDVKKPVQPKGWTLYRNDAGFSFSYPSDWKTMVNKQFIRLIPPNAQKNERGDWLEEYLVVQEVARNIKNPADPAVAQYFDTQVPQLVGGMKRTTPMTAMKCANGNGGVYNYTGTTGVGAVRIDVYVTLMDDHAVYLLVLGRKDLIDKKLKVAADIFSTFQFRKPKAVVPDVSGKGKMPAPEPVTPEVKEPTKGSGDDMDDDDDDSDDTEAEPLG